MAEEKKAVGAVKKVKVKLFKDHTHAGTAYKAGETIEVREDQATWLGEAGVIEKKKEG